MRLPLVARCACLFLVSSWFAACGGGGGGGGSAGTPSTVDTDNAAVVARAAVGALDAVSGTVAAVEGLDDVAGEGAAPRAASAVDVDQTLDCPQGGTVQVSLHVDLENLLQGPAVGNTGSFAFDACRRADPDAEGGAVTLGGQVGYTVTGASGSLLAGDYDLTYGYSFDGFRVAESAGASLTADGAFTVRAQGQPPNGRQITVSAASFTVTGDADTLRLSDFHLQALFQTDPDSYEIRADGTVSSAAADGSIAVETLAPFTGTVEDPVDGMLRVTADDGTSVTVVIEDSVVRLEVDADGDGAVDATIPVVWEDLAP